MRLRVRWRRGGSGISPAAAYSMSLIRSRFSASRVRIFHCRVDVPYCPSLLHNLLIRFVIGRVTTLTPQITPSRCRPLALAGSFTSRFQIGEQRANPFPPHAGADLFDVVETELTGLPADCREHQPCLCPARGFDLTGKPTRRTNETR